MISVVIPIVNEAARLPALLRVLAGESAIGEVIVVDGASDDGGPAVARAFGAQVLTTERSRGAQLNAGAAMASGDVLWFLHADSRPSPGCVAAISDALDADPEVVGGNFRLFFDGDDGFSRWLDGFYGWIRRHGFYYGDSGVFVRRKTYDALGGIQALALMEDYDFNRRLERAGRTVCLCQPAMVTSSRRFRGRHPVAIVSGWLLIHALFHCGVDPARLARLYRSDRRRAESGNVQTPPDAAFKDQS